MGNYMDLDYQMISKVFLAVIAAAGPFAIFVLLDTDAVIWRQMLEHLKSLRAELENQDKRIHGRIMIMANKHGLINKLKKEQAGGSFRKDNPGTSSGEVSR